MAIIQTIAPTECVGNSLSKINNNFAALNTELTRVETFRSSTTTISPNNSNAPKLIMSLNGTLTAARSGIDYLSVSTPFTGIIKYENSNLVQAVSSEDYYAPGSILQASDTTINGTLKSTGDASFASTFVNGILSSSSQAFFGDGGTTTRGCNIKGDLTCSGSVYADSNKLTSDARLKTNIETIEYPLQKIEQLRGVTFNWIKDLIPDIGVIAQEVEQVIPEAVETVVAEGEETKYVAYNKIIPLLIESVKALKAEVDYLRSRVDQP